MHTAYSFKRVPRTLARDRLVIKGFKTSDAMHTFLNAGGNGLDWRPTTERPEFASFKPGTYAYAGGAWHNVKSLDPSILAHI